MAPQPITGSQLFSSRWAGLAGPAVEVADWSGDTSGRFEVARLIARVFPGEKAFVQGVVGEGVEAPSEFPHGPYPTDKLIRKGDRIVEYQTPPRSEGLGTMGELRANSRPISGVAILHGGRPTH